MLENKYFLFFFFILIVNFFLVKKYQLFAKFIGLYDVPNEYRKKHKLPIPLIGGFFLLINLIIFFLFEFFIINRVHLSDTYYLNNYFLDSKKEIFSFLFCSICLFLIGFFDDKYNLDPFKKLLSSIVIFYIFFSLDNSLIINELNFTFVGYSIQLDELSLFISIFLSVFFLNSINMYDGINGLVGLTIFNIFIYFMLNNFMPMFALLLLISILFFLFLNLKGKIFFGDSGCYILSFILCYFFLRYYNSGLIKLDEIFLIFFLPLLDAVRVFITRIFISGQPWKADDNHLHHRISKKYNNNVALIILYLLSLFTILFVNFFSVNHIFSIFFALIIYFFCFIKLR